MKNKTGTLTNIVALMVAQGLVAPAFAAGAREDTGGIFVWIFLALCALIIVAQLIPALLVLAGFAKGLRKEKPPEAVPKNAD